MKISNCCGANMDMIFQDIEICPDCKEHCEIEEECTLSPDCKCEDCQDMANEEIMGNEYGD